VNAIPRIRDWLGLSTTQRNHPRYVELIVASSGRTAFTLRLNIYYLHWAVAGLALIATLWLGGLAWAAYDHYANSDALDHMDEMALQVKQLEQHNSDLTQSRTALAGHYQDMLNKLDNLESKVRQLATRYHFGDQAKSGTSASVGGMGGIAYPVEPNAGMSMMQQQAQSRIVSLNQALDRIMARPHGWPIAGAEITSRFGVRANPFGEANLEFHKGLDFSAAFATPVQVTAPGVVVAAGFAGANGNLVEVDHGYGYRTGYAHLSAIKVKVGETLKAGQVIGLLGNTGRSTGPHLHYAVFINNELVDPYPFIE
jgi:murein DD-endopeptidase MepM/ murein hydrolase activator NlpD